KFSDQRVRPGGLGDNKAANNLLLLVQRRGVGQHVNGPGDRSQGITDLLGDAGGQSSYRRQPLPHADLALKTAKFRPIIKRVHVADSSLLRNGQRSHRYAKSLLSTAGRQSPHFSLRRR